MDKTTKNFLIGAGVTLLGIGAVTVVSYRIVSELMKIAMDRKEPEIVTKNKSKIMGSGDLDHIIERMDEAEKELLGAGLETVEIESHDGLKLVGHLHRCKNPKRVIVSMHGWRSSWAKDFGIISKFVHDNDCMVLYAEQRGQGNSEGEYMSFGLLERFDCLDWVNYMNELTGGKLPIYMSGLSMGASTILMTAGLPLPHNVKGIIADCGFTSPQDIWKHVVENNFHIPYFGLSIVADIMSKQKINIGAEDYSTVEAMKVCRTPVLFIHGTDDHFVPVEMTYENYKACRAPKRLLVVPGADHGMSYIVNQKAYERAVLKFWEDFDNAPINYGKQDEHHELEPLE